MTGTRQAFGVKPTVRVYPEEPDDSSRPIAAENGRHIIAPFVGAKDCIGMTTSFHSAGLALLLGAACMGASAQAEANKAADRCEASVTETIQRVRGKQALDVQFVGGKRALSTTDEDETGVKGEGRYRTPAGASVSFSYSCAFNAKTSSTSGVVFRELGNTQATPEPVWQPDLSNVVPEACESAVAVVLKDKYPRVDHIAFDAETRQLRPAPHAHTSLEGRGTLARAPGMSPSAFGYRCELDTRSGKLLNAQASE